jgi:next-to-BRCA1 protein 1
LNQIPFSLTLQALEAKIRDLFNLSPSTSLIVTYIDKENDVVTLGDDQDLIDACVIQKLNPLRLEVQVASEKQKDEEKARGDAGPSMVKDEKNANHSNNNNDIPTVDIETLLTALFPQATLGTIRNFLQSHTAQFIDPKLTEEVVHKAEESFKEVLNNLNKFSARTAEKTVQEVLSSLKKSSSHKAAGTSRSDIGEKNGDLPHNHEEKQTSSKQEDKERNPVRHEGVQCDICNMVPIVGPRYKSTK